MRARPAALLAVIAGVVVLLVVLVWFQPQTALFDTVVDEDFPAGAGEPASTGDASDGGASDGGADAPAGAQPLATGIFEGRNNHRVTGSATVYELDDGSRTLRLEAFESDNGPDLLVYLTVADHAAADEALGGDFVSLGPLTGNVGNQNYAVPVDVDLDRYDTAVIWCRRFSVSFGAADLA